MEIEDLARVIDARFIDQEMLVRRNQQIQKGLGLAILALTERGTELEHAIRGFALKCLLDPDSRFTVDQLWQIVGAEGGKSE